MPNWTAKRQKVCPAKKYASTPQEIANASSPSSSLAETTCFDGIACIGKTFSILQPKGPVSFKRELEVLQKRPGNYKGLPQVTPYSTVYEISVGYTFAFELSILLCSTNDELTEYRDLISWVHKCIERAILCCGYTSRSRRIFLSTFGENRQVYPQDWSKFSDEFRKSFNDNFVLQPKTVDQRPDESSNEKPRSKPNQFSDFLNIHPQKSHRFYILAKRMGQDLNILDSIDFSKLSKNYNEIQLKSGPDNIESIAIHIAKDLYPNESDYLMWRLDKIQEKVGSSGKIFNQFCIPGLGNYAQQFPVIGNDSPYRFVQFYTRCGHQLHREKSTCFKEPFVTDRLLDAQICFLSSSLSAEIIKKKQRVLEKLLGRFDCIGHLIDQVPLRSAARCEVVYEHRCQLENGSLCPLEFPYILKRCFYLTTRWIQKENLISLGNLVSFPSHVLQDWLQSILKPCQKMLYKSTQESLQNINFLVSKQLCEVPDQAIGGHTDYLNYLVCESLITLFIRGELSSKWPVYLRRYLGFDTVRFGKHGDIHKISCVQFHNLRIECNHIPFEHFDMCVFRGISATGMYGELLTYLNEFKSHSCENAVDRTDLTNIIGLEFLAMLLNVACSTAGIKTVSSGKVSLSVVLALKNQTPLAKSVSCSSEFVEKIRLGQINPAIVSTVYKLILNIVNGVVGINFLNVLVQQINQTMLEQGSGFYFPLTRQSHIAVVPTDIFHDKLVKIYSDVFRWWANREVGLRGINCNIIFQQTLPLFIREERVRICSEKLAVNNYFQLVNYFLDNMHLENAIQLIKPCTCSETLLNKLCNIT